MMESSSIFENLSNISANIGDNECENTSKNKKNKKSKSAKNMTNNSENLNHNNTSQELRHEYEKWLEQTANFDYSTEYSNFQNSQILQNLQQPQSLLNISSGSRSNNTTNKHLQDFNLNNPISLPSQNNSQNRFEPTCSPSISSFLNFNSNFKQQFSQYQQPPTAELPIAINSDPMSSINSQPEYLSLPKIPSIDENNLLLDNRHDTPNIVRNKSDSEESGGENNNSGNDSNSKQNKVETDTILVNLMKQINFLHETNSKLFRNLHEAKVEIEALKFAPPPWKGGISRRDSVSGLSVFSTPFLGTQSPAPTYHSTGSYPGIVSDLIREVRDASRVKEEATVNKIKSIIEEKFWTSNENHLRMLRELEDVKIQLHNLKLDKQLTNDRLTRLEEEMRSVKNNLLASTNSHPMYQQQPQFPVNDPMQLNQLKRNQMNLNYGSGELSFNNDDNHSIERSPEYLKMKRSSLPFLPSQGSPRDNNRELFGRNQQQHSIDVIRRNQQQQQQHEPIDEEIYDGNQIIQVEKDTIQLRRDLEKALASKKEAESRILALEHMVTSLKHNMSSNHKHGGNGSTSKELMRKSTNSPIEQHLESPVMTTATKLLSPKPQKTTQIQTVSPKNVVMSPNGPVTDL